MKEMKNKRERKISILFILTALLVAFRIWLAVSIPLCAFGKGVDDDVLLFRYAQNIANGHWLGAYDFRTLLKGITYPLFVALCYDLSIPYSLGIICIYCFSCFIMTRALRPVIKNKFVSAAIFLLLLYSPVMMTFDYVQRMYRMAIIPTFVLLVFGFQIGAYLRIREKSNRLCIWILGEGISLALFWYIREDSLWVFPFILVSSVVMFIIMHREKRPFREKSILLMPFISVMIFTVAIGSINFVKYDDFELTELRLYIPNEYNTFMGYLEDIEPEKEIEGVEVTRASILKACDVSPTLNTARENIEKFYDDNWTVWGGGDVKGEIKGSYYWWALKYIMQDMGLYENSDTSENFLNNVNEELKQAFADGKLTKKKDNGFIQTIIKDRSNIFGKIVESTGDINGYSVCRTLIEMSEGPEKYVRLMENMSEGRIIYPNEITVRGWIISNKAENQIDAYLTDSEGNELSRVEFLESPDVYAIYKTPSSKNARFTADIPYDLIDEDLYLNVYLNGEFYKNIKLEESSSDNDEYITYATDDYIRKDEVLLDKGSFAVSICNFIIKAYKLFSWLLFAIAVIAYVYVTVKFLLKAGKTENPYTEMWLILSAFLLSFVALLFLVCYRYRIAWNTDFRWFYLAGAFPLLQIFKYCGAFFVIRDVSKYYDKK